MYRTQRGLSMTTFLVAAVVLILLALVGMRVGPAYLEYFKVKKAVTNVAVEGRGATVLELRRGFDRRAAIDDIDILSGNDLDISKEGGEVVVSFAYSKKVPLFSNVSLLIEFAGASSQ